LASSSLKHQSIPGHLEPLLKLYRRLWLSRLDLEEAKGIAAELLLRKIPLHRSKPPSGLLLALNTALVVAYARPFVNSWGVSVAERAVPGSLLRVLSSDERDFHEALLDLRNKEVAHSDADFIELSIELYDGGDGGVLRATRQPLRLSAVRSLNRMIEKIDGEIDRKCEELRTKLPLNVWL
jgi:hypothetical protein